MPRIGQDSKLGGGVRSGLDPGAELSAVRLDGRSFSQPMCPTWKRDRCHYSGARPVGTLDASRGSLAETGATRGDR